MIDVNILNFLITWPNKKILLVFATKIIPEFHCIGYIIQVHVLFFYLKYYIGFLKIYYIHWCPIFPWTILQWYDYIVEKYSRKCPDKIPCNDDCKMTLLIFVLLCHWKLTANIFMFLRVLFFYYLLGN